MDKSKLQTFILLEKERRALEDKVKAIKAETAQLQQDILDEFSEMGIQRITMNGLTAYVFNDNSLRITDRSKAIELLKKNGYWDFVQQVPNSMNMSRIMFILSEIEKDTGEKLTDWELSVSELLGAYLSELADETLGNKPTVELVKEMEDQGIAEVITSKSIRTRRVNGNKKETAKAVNS